MSALFSARKPALTQSPLRKRVMTQRRVSLSAINRSSAHVVGLANAKPKRVHRPTDATVTQSRNKHSRA